MAESIQNGTLTESQRNAIIKDLSRGYDLGRGIPPSEIFKITSPSALNTRSGRQWLVDTVYRMRGAPLQAFLIRLGVGLPKAPAHA